MRTGAGGRAAKFHNQQAELYAIERVSSTRSAGWASRSRRGSAEAEDEAPAWRVSQLRVHVGTMGAIHRRGFEGTAGPEIRHPLQNMRIQQRSMDAWVMDSMRQLTDL